MLPSTKVWPPVPPRAGRACLVRCNDGITSFIVESGGFVNELHPTGPTGTPAPNETEGALALVHPVETRPAGARSHIARGRHPDDGDDHQHEADLARAS